LQAIQRQNPRQSRKDSSCDYHLLRRQVFRFCNQDSSRGYPESGSAEPNRKKVAEITWEQVRTIAQDKMVDLNCFTVEAAMKMVAGTARSMGIAVKGEFPVNN